MSTNSELSGTGLKPHKYRSLSGLRLSQSSQNSAKSKRVAKKPTRPKSALSQTRSEPRSDDDKSRPRSERIKRRPSWNDTWNTDFEEFKLSPRERERRKDSFKSRNLEVVRLQEEEKAIARASRLLGDTPKNTGRPNKSGILQEILCDEKEFKAFLGGGDIVKELFATSSKEDGKTRSTRPRRIYGLASFTQAPTLESNKNEVLTSTTPEPDLVVGDRAPSRGIISEPDCLNRTDLTDEMLPERPLSAEKEKKAKGSLPLEMIDKIEKVINDGEDEVFNSKTSSSSPVRTVDDDVRAEIKKAKREIIELRKQIEAAAQKIHQKETEADGMKTFLDLLTADVLSIREEQKEMRQCFEQIYKRQEDGIKELRLKMDRFAAVLDLATRRSALEASMLQPLREVSAFVNSVSPTAMQSVVQKMKNSPSEKLQQLTACQAAMTRKKLATDPEEFQRQELIPFSGEEATANLFSYGRNRSPEVVLSCGQYASCKTSDVPISLPSPRERTLISLPFRENSSVNIANNGTHPLVTSSTRVSKFDSQVLDQVLQRNSAPKRQAKVNDPPDSIKRLELQIQSLTLQQQDAQQRLNDLKLLGSHNSERQTFVPENSANTQTSEPRVSLLDSIGSSFPIGRQLQNQLAASETTLPNTQDTFLSFRPKEVVTNSEAASLFEYQKEFDPPLSTTEPSLLNLKESVGRNCPSPPFNVETTVSSLKSNMAIDFEDELKELQRQHTHARRLLTDLISQSGIDVKVVEARPKDDQDATTSVSIKDFSSNKENISVSMSGVNLLSTSPTSDATTLDFRPLESEADYSFNFK